MIQRQHCGIRVSIVMPMRNAAGTVRQSLESVLNSSYANLEILVIDDGSTDGSEEIVRSIRDGRVNVHPNAGRGQSDALNTGISHATGALFMRCDADDLYHPERIAWQIPWLQQHPDVAAVCGYVSAMLHNGKLLAPLKGRLADGHDAGADLRRGVMCSHLGAYAIRIEAARAIRFRPFFRYSQDYDFLFRLAERFEIRYCRRPAYTIRLTEGSVTHSTPLALRQWYLERAEAFRKERTTNGSDALERGESPNPPEGLEQQREVEHVSGAAAALLDSAAWTSLAEGERAPAIAYACRAVAMAPRHRHFWRNLAVVAIKASLWPTSSLRTPAGATA